MGSITTQSHIISELTFIGFIYDIFLDFPFPKIFPRLVLLNPVSDRNMTYFAIFKNDNNALTVFLKDNSRKYKYKPYPMRFEWVLFLSI